MRALLVELIEFILERLFVSSRVPTHEGVRSNVIHVQGVGNGHKVSALQLDDERLVGARLIDVVLEAETLEDIERVWRVANEVGVPANWRLPSGLLDALDAVDDESALGVRIEGIAVLPGAAVRRCLMTATHNIARKIGRLVYGFADHEGSELDLVLVHQVEDSGDALVHAVLEDAVGRQIGQTLLHWFFEEAGRAGDRLTAALKHEREADGKTGTVRPERISRRHDALLFSG